MDVDSVESDAAEEPEEGVESMDVDEPESEEEKPKKKATTSKKRKLSVSDEEAEASEKPTKTPKKAIAKAKTPKTTTKTPKTPKTPANGTVKAAAKPKVATTAKKPVPPKGAAKKKAPARNSKAKSAEKIDVSDSEGEEASSEVTKEEEKIDPAEFQLKQVKALRGRLQRGFLDKNKPPVASVRFPGGHFFWHMILGLTRFLRFRTWQIWLRSLTF